MIYKIHFVFSEIVCVFRKKQYSLFLATGFAFCVLFLSCQSIQAMPNAWPPEYENFLSELTFPSSQWSEVLGKKPSESDLILLEKYKPQIFIGPSGLMPINFYEDYVAHCQLKDPSGKVVETRVTPQILKRYERSFGYYLDHDESPPSCLGKSCEGRDVPVYGRVYREKLDLEQDSNEFQTQKSDDNILILKYNLVFQASGLPEKIGKFTEALAHLAGDPSLWHELDIHGAIHLLIDLTTEKPLAIVLAQHNHFRTYVFGQEIPLPEKQGIKICYSQRSNEPYLCQDKTKEYPTSGNPGELPYVITGEKPGFLAGKDLVFGLSEGAVRVKANLKTLNHLDPFYVSWIDMGEPKKLFGIIPSFYRNGPPGADINRFSQLKNYVDLAKFYYFATNDRQALDIYRSSNLDFLSADVAPILSHNGRQFIKAIRQTSSK